MKAIFVQSRHPNAPDEGNGHVYMPSSILTATARALRAGGDVRFADENVERLTDEEIADADVIGINSVGPSWIPSSLDLQERIRTINPAATVLQGGQVVSSLDRDPFGDAPRFKRVFGDALNGNDDRNVLKALDLTALEPPSATSLIPAYETLSEELLREYLSSRFSFYLSQGCRFACAFCSAVRSRRDPATGRVHKVQETYREMEVLGEDLAWLMTRAREFGIAGLDNYLSSLDICQTPDKLDEFADVVLDVRKRFPEMGLRLTALSTVDSFKRLQDGSPETLRKMRRAGLMNIAFGVEGMSKDYWKELKKGHNNEDDCYNVIRDSIQEFGFTTEILLTPGHEHETQETLQTTLEYARHMQREYGALIRPYAAKTWLVGNDGWHGEEYAPQVEQVLERPELFQNLDINAEQSSLTEVDPAIGPHVNDAFRALCRLSDHEALRAIEPSMTALEIAEVRAANLGKYDY